MDLTSPTLTTESKPRPRLVNPNARGTNKEESWSEMMLGKLETRLNDIHVCKKLLSKVVSIVMEEVESEGLNGEKAKQASIKLVKLLITEKAPPSEKEWMLEAVDAEVISELIDMIILATKGELEINHGTKFAKKCVPCSIKTVLKRFKT